MTSYSSDEFNHDWRFRIGQDFVDSSGEAYEYAEHGLKEWGDEFLNIPFSTHVRKHGAKVAAISHDARYIAVNDGFDVQVFDIAGDKRIYSLQGHVSEIDGIAFRPGHPTQLVTVAQQSFAGSGSADPEIILWDLKKVADHTQIDPKDIEQVSRNAANAVVAELKLKPVSFDLTANDQKALAEIMLDPITQLVRSKSQAPSARLFGRLASKFQSEVFSSSGKLMFYMPGPRPNSNGDDDWQLRLATVDSLEDYISLSGNRDAIMWTGLNHDESLVGTACWDRSFRIWDTKHGHQQYVWRTEAQNWTAAFSPNGRYFAGTSGDGKLHVYNLIDGSNHFVLQTGKDWPRCLSWHPKMPLIAVGGSGLGRLSLIDATDGKAIQVRKLSMEATQIPDELREPIGNSYLEVVNVRFVDGGRKIAFMTSGDGSAEVYDIRDAVKWRFARAGTMNAPDDHSPVTSRSGYDMVVYEDASAKRVMLLTIDGDAVRVWHVPTSS